MNFTCTLPKAPALEVVCTLPDANASSLTPAIIVASIAAFAAICAAASSSPTSALTPYTAAMAIQAVDKERAVAAMDQVRTLMQRYKNDLNSPSASS